MSLTHWTILYNVALQSQPQSFLETSQEAKDEIRSRAEEIGSSRDNADLREYAALMLALTDLNVLMSSFWNHHLCTVLPALAQDLLDHGPRRERRKVNPLIRGQWRLA